METFSFGEGMNLHVIYTEKFRTTRICALLRRPLTREDATANALIPKVLQRGCSSFDSLSKLNIALEELYGAVFDAQILKKGEEQLMQFYLELVDKDDLLIKGLDLLSQLICKPLVKEDGFDPGYTQGEKENLKNNIHGRTNDKKSYANLRALEEMFWKGGRNEPFGLYGDGYAEDLEGLNGQNLYQRYQNVLRTSPMDFVVIGKVDPVFLEAQLKSLFPLDRDSLIELPTPSAVFEKQERRQAEEDQGLTQGKICFGFRTGVEPAVDDFFQLMTMNELLGGGASSRLFSHIREKENLCYYINSFIYRFKSVLFVQSGVDADKFDAVTDLLLQNIEAVAKGDVSDEELERAKGSLVKKFQGIFDYPSAIMDFYVGQKMLNDETTIEDVIEKIKQTKKEQVCQMAGKLHLDTVFRLR